MRRIQALGRYFTLVTLVLSVLSFAGAQSRFPLIEDVMDAPLMQMTGVYKLTSTELAALNSWLEMYSLVILDVYGDTAPAISSVTPTAPRGSSQDVIESRIDGTFEGWTGETIFKLTNGQIWQQDQYAYTYHYAYRPEVIIVRSAGGYTMSVEGLRSTIRVRRLQ